TGAGGFGEGPIEGFAGAAIALGGGVEEKGGGGVLARAVEGGGDGDGDGADDGGGDLGGEVGRFVSVELDGGEGDGGEGVLDGAEVGVDEDADEADAAGDDGGDAGGLVEGDAASGFGPEVEADGVGAGADGGLGVLGRGDAADLHLEGGGGGAAELAEERARVLGAHEGFADEEGAGAGAAEAAGVGGGADARFDDAGLGAAEEREEAFGGGEVHLEGAEVAVVDADQGGAVDALELLFIVDLDEGAQVEGGGEVEAADEEVAVEGGGDEEDEVGAGGAGLEELVLVDDEVLAEDGDVDGGADSAEVIERAAEAGAVGEDGDG